jgi:hypothetical protein
LNAISQLSVPCSLIATLTESPGATVSLIGCDAAGSISIQAS